MFSWKSLFAQTIGRNSCRLWDTKCEGIHNWHSHWPWMRSYLLYCHWFCKVRLESTHSAQSGLLNMLFHHRHYSCIRLKIEQDLKSISPIKYVNSFICLGESNFHALIPWDFPLDSGHLCSSTQVPSARQGSLESTQSQV